MFQRIRYCLSGLPRLREVRYRVRYGYWPREAWDLRSAFAEWVIPRLRGLYREECTGDFSCETEWCGTIQKMIDGFEAHQRLDASVPEDDPIELADLAAEAGELFGKNFLRLWS